MHPAVNGNKAAGNNFPANGPAQAATNGAPDPSGPIDFGGTDFGNLDFAQGDGPDVLENFDFDSFLHNTDDANGFGTFDFMNLCGFPLVLSIQSLDVN